MSTLQERANTAEVNLLKMLDHQKKYISEMSEEQKNGYTGRLIQKQFTITEIYYKTSMEVIRHLSAEIASLELSKHNLDVVGPNDNLFSNCYKF